MIKITQEEFEEKIQELVEGKKSRTELVTELKTDFRTLNNKIQMLSVYNVDLYLKFIEKFPYKQKERDDIDYEALIIKIMKDGLTISGASSKYNVGERTLRRKFKKIEETNPELIKIYSEYKYNNKHNIKNSYELEEKISKLISTPVKIGELNESRKKQLEDMEEVFNRRSLHVSKEEAARTMGMTMNRMYKLLNELYRIRIEEKHKKDDTFKESLKVSNNDIYTNTDNNASINNSGNLAIEESEKGER